MDSNFCKCGSGFFPFPIFDASNIYCGKACIVCEEQLKAKCRSEIFTNPDYKTNEPKEPE